RACCPTPPPLPSDEAVAGEPLPGDRASDPELDVGCHAPEMDERIGVERLRLHRNREPPGVVHSVDRDGRPPQALGEPIAPAVPGADGDEETVVVDLELVRRAGMDPRQLARVTDEAVGVDLAPPVPRAVDRKSTRLNSS